MFTPEDEIDELHMEIGRARRQLISLERAPHEGRWTRSSTDWMDACANQRRRVKVLETQLGELLAEQRMAEEEHAA